MASHMEWHLPVQEKAEWLACLKIKLENVAKRATSMHLISAHKCQTRLDFWPIHTILEVGERTVHSNTFHWL